MPVPRQIVLPAPAEGGSQSATAVGMPLVLKPARSAVSTSGGMGKFGVTIVTDAADLAPALPRYPPEAYPLLVQERIVGPGLGVFLLAWEGRSWPRSRTAGSVRSRPTGGVSVYRESVAVAPDLRDYSERLLERFRWRGAAMVEFKEDAGTGTPYLMEINGRFWGSLQLAIDAGVDFPAILVAAALGEPIPALPPFREGIRCRWLWGDVDHLIWMLRTPGRVRAAHPDLPGRLGALARFLVPWRPGDRFEVLRASDPGPFLRETANWFGSLRGGRGG